MTEKNTQTATAISTPTHTHPKAAALAAARLASQTARANGIPVERLTPTEKHVAEPRSLRKAVTAKCWDCVGAGQDPNPREQIRECPMTRCALHSVRPFQRKST